MPEDAPAAPFHLAEHGAARRDGQAQLEREAEGNAPHDGTSPLVELARRAAFVDEEACEQPAVRRAREEKWH